MKKLYSLLLITFMMLVMTACGDSKEAPAEAESDTLKAELVKFVNEDLTAIAADRDSAVAVYNSYFDETSEISSDDWAARLESEALVSYSTYLTNLQAIEVTSPEVENLKTLFVQSSQLQYDAMNDVVNAVKNEDTSLLDSAQLKITESNTYFAQYEAALKELADANGITVNGSFSTITDTATPQDADIQ